MKLGIISKLILSTVVAGALAEGASHANEPADLDERFRQVAVGLTRDAVTALMGKPDFDVEFDTLTVPSSRLKWSGTDGRSFIVTFVYNRVVMTKICSGAGGC
jgi:hypothetical protein